jgi:CelD/BcsL family acetyltransferase involved in cellulose biosynthesis
VSNNGSWQFRAVNPEEVSANEGLIEEWISLWRTCPDATPFQTPQWVLPFYRHFTGGRGTILIGEKQDRLEFVLPLFRCIDRHGDRLLLAGSGVSDYLDATVSSTTDLSPALLWRWLEKVASDVSAYEFQQLNDQSYLLALDPGQGWERLTVAHNVSPQLTLPKLPEKLPANLPSPMAREVSYLLRRAAKSGQVDLRQSTGATLAGDIEDFVALHAQRWATRSDQGIFHSEPAKAFYREAWTGLNDLGLLRLFNLSIENWPIAALCGYQCRQMFYYYIGGFDPEASKLSPGTLLIWLVLQQVWRDGCTTFDFLRGAEPYKYRWGARDVPTFSVKLVRVEGRR